MQLSGKYTNTFTADSFHSGIIYITTTPSFAIGQRAILCCSPAGNVLWDCITYLDDSTISRINDLGGITAIAISHPHFYSTSLHWAAAFNCKVLLSAEDSQWLMRRGDAHELWEGKQRDLVGEFTVVKVGGHFPGSSVMLWKREKKLFVADSIMVVPSGVYQVDRPQGTTSFTFMWSYPNYVSCSSESWRLKYGKVEFYGSLTKCRSLCHLMTCLGSGKPSRTWILRTHTGCQWVGTRGEGVSSEC